MVTVESMPKQEGRNMIMVISPNKRYMEQLARAQAREPQEQVEPEPEPASEPEAALEPAPGPESVPGSDQPEPVSTAAAPDPDEG
jgi:translation initiation factor IF-3